MAAKPEKNTENKRAPHPMDIHVGSRVRLRRMMQGLSQDRLGEELGLTFQQVQKYEKGINRIGAARLWEIGRILDVPVQFFYDDYGDGPETMIGFAETHPDHGDDKSDFLAVLSTPEGMQLCRAFAKIKDYQVRRRVLDLVKTLGEDDGGDD
ncbi:helix-turn-helix domain-containing protein [Parvularcula dongshanensis]|uniref:Transcriptional regulator with XRE-family HTH domain n=1 Tax=Parvularcula dongshanensis TaxID=1173995 RepID=A0A840I1B4_9PROT|nr:helix-turn-helix transcriptional regulator [Parvularcula dongshanensis]MBB4658002.1 transcriptional regulator with XRE-family HTH domain [Parvularcula dongshanensis]